MPTLTTTSYAVLAHLAVQPWSAYDLAGQLTRGFDLVWPRAESQVYAEPKRLVELGLATASTEATGRRTRQVYAITERGRVALAEWLATPTAPARTESEPLVRVFFAEHGSRDDLEATIEAMETHAAATTTRLVEQISGYLRAGGPYPHRWPVIALGASALLAQAAAIEAWAAAALEEIAEWPDVPTDPSEGERLLREVLERFAPTPDRGPANGG